MSAMPLLWKCCPSWVARIQQDRKSELWLLVLRLSKMPNVIFRNMPKRRYYPVEHKAQKTITT